MLGLACPLNDVDKVIKKFSEVVSPFVKDMEQWLEYKELQEENEMLREIVVKQELLILNQKKLLKIAAKVTDGD